MPKINPVNYCVKLRNNYAHNISSHIRLIINVGKEHHEAGQFMATIDWINNQSQIQEVHVSINDLVQRHFYEAMGMPAEKALQIARNEGNWWLMRNEGLLNEIRAKTTRTHWNEWSNQSGFEKTKAEILSLRESNQQLMNAMKKDALAEQRVRKNNSLSSSLLPHSLHYVTEQMTINALQTMALPFIEIYPGHDLQSIQYLQRLAKSNIGSLPEAIRPLAQRHFVGITLNPIYTPMTI